MKNAGVKTPCHFNVIGHPRSKERGYSSQGYLELLCLQPVPVVESSDEAERIETTRKKKIIIEKSHLNGHELQLVDQNSLTIFGVSTPINGKRRG